MAEKHRNTPAYIRSIEELARDLKRHKSLGKRTTLMIGAGCSFSGGIPLASGLIERIKNNYSDAYQRGMERTPEGESPYGYCMDALTPSDRQELFKTDIETAKVNLAHTAIASLMKHGYIQRVVSVNFDNLLVRACAMEHLFPAIYDLTVAPGFARHDHLAETEIFYLHGQLANYHIKNTAEETTRQAKYLKPCFKFDPGCDLWIIAGYSGDNDAVFRTHLSRVREFRSGLYWVGYREDDPVETVRTALFSKQKYAYLIKPFGADEFFLELTRTLEIFPPSFIGAPFSYLDDVLNQLGDWSQAGKSNLPDVIEPTRNIIKHAVSFYEARTLTSQDNTLSLSSLILQANAAVMSGDYQRVLTLSKQEADEIDNELRDPAAWAYSTMSEKLVKKANESPEKEKLLLLEQAEYLNDQAVKLRTDDPDFFERYAHTFVTMAELCTEERRERLIEKAFKTIEYGYRDDPRSDYALSAYGDLFLAISEISNPVNTPQYLEQAVEMYREIPAESNAYNSSLHMQGLSLLRLARLKKGEEKISLLREAIAKNALAVKFKPYSADLLYNQGLTLIDLANELPKEQKLDILKEALEHFQKSSQMKPNNDYNLDSWGSTLSELAEEETGDVQIELFTEAVEKHRLAIALSPNESAYRNNLGWTLQCLAKFASSQQKHKIFEEARKSYQTALKLEPKDMDSLTNMARMLAQWGHEETGEKQQRLWQNATAYFLKAEEVVPGDSAYELACLAALMGKEEECRIWLNECIQYSTLENRAHMEQDTDLDSVRDKPWFQEILAQAPIE